MIRFRKPFYLLLILAVILALPLAGCGSEDAEDTETVIEHPVNPVPDPAKSKAANAEERAREILDSMTVDQKVGQVILARCPAMDQAEQMAYFQFGGYVLYDRDFQDDEGAFLSKDAVTERIDSYRSAAAVTPFIAVDEEGGTVVRASDDPALFPEGPAKAPREIYKNGGAQALYEDAARKSETLLSCGINLNLAPVADVCTKEESFMYERSLGVDAETTAELTAGMVSAMKASGIGAVLKHFPGYGDSGDSHGGIEVDDTRPLEAFRSGDFLPFESGIGAGAGGIMVSHIRAAAIDDKYPVSLSKEADRILREELEFDGVVLTDDLFMLDTGKYGLPDQPAVLAILAGNDMVISSSLAKDYNDIFNAVKRGELSEERLDESVLRILKWKLDLGVQQ